MDKLFGGNGGANSGSNPKCPTDSREREDATLNDSAAGEPDGSTPCHKVQKTRTSFFSAMSPRSGGRRPWSKRHPAPIDENVPTGPVPPPRPSRCSKPDRDAYLLPKVALTPMAQTARNPNLPDCGQFYELQTRAMRAGNVRMWI